MEICRYMSNMIQAWKKIREGPLSCQMYSVARHAALEPRIDDFTTSNHDLNKAALAASVLQIWLHG